MASFGDVGTPPTADAAYNIPGDAVALENEIAQLRAEQTVNNNRTQAALAALTAMQDRARDAESAAAAAQPVPASPGLEDVSHGDVEGFLSDASAEPSSPPQPGTEAWAQRVLAQVKEMTDSLARHGFAPGPGKTPTKDDGAVAGNVQAENLKGPSSGPFGIGGNTGGSTTGHGRRHSGSI